MKRQYWTVGLMVLGAILGAACGVFTVKAYNAEGVGIFMGFTILGTVVGAIFASLLHRLAS